MIFPFLDIPLVNTVTNTPIRPRFRPIIPLLVAGPNGRITHIHVLVDTGADEVILPIALLPHLGFTRGTGPTRGTTGIGGRSQTIYHPVRLELRASATDRLIWNTVVAFGPVPINIGMFGIAGGLEFFHTSINVIDRQLVLYPHHMMPLVPPSAAPHTPFPIP